MDAYQYTLGVAELYGPTNYLPILEKAMSYASSSVTQTKQCYHVLLIITVNETETCSLIPRMYTNNI